MSGCVFNTLEMKSLTGIVHGKILGRVDCKLLRIG